MALQLSAALRNSMAARPEAEIGTGATLELRTGAPPATPETSDSGTLLLAIALPADRLGAPRGGAVALAGVWSGTVATSGTAGHFRIKSSGGVVGMQGTVSQRESSGGAGEMLLAQETAALVAGQTVTVSTFGLTVQGA